ncbi:MAG: hypothetical protein ABIY70_00265, partial [Capsulimonas sp.]|uniref:hypothetical protein n=1 Tax=Capsulimonas sp. TaxID=2494211 RepID=UPI003264022E
GGIVTLRKLYSYDAASRRIVTTIQGFPFTPFESLPESNGPLTYTRRTAYWGPAQYSQKKIEIDPAGRRVFYDYYDSHAAPELRGNLRAVYADVSAGAKNGRAVAYNPFDRPMSASGQAALAARPRPGAVPVLQISEFDPLGHPRTIRTLQSLSPTRFTIERRAPATAPLGLSTQGAVTEQREAEKTTTSYDALGRIVRKTITRAGRIVAETHTAYAHDGSDLLASDGEVARRRRLGADGKPSTQEFQYTPAGLLQSFSDHDGDGPVIRRSVQYETCEGAATRRPLALTETWDGAPRFRMTYTYGGFGGEDLIRKTLTVLGSPNETWSWDYGRTFTAADIAMRRIPSRIVQTAPPSAHLPVQAIDYLYDSCLGSLGLVRFDVVDSNPSELATQWLQDQHPSRFQFLWYAHDSFGRTYDIRRYRAQYGQAPRLNAYTYTLTSRTERFRLTPDPNNLSGYDPTTFTTATAPYNPAGNIPYQRTTQFAPDGKTPRTTQQEVRGYDLSDRLATSKSYASVGDWTRATHSDAEDYDGLTQPLWTPGSDFQPDAPISRRVRRAGGGYAEIFYDSGQPLMEREYDRKGKLARVRTRIIGARGVEAVTESNKQKGRHSCE